ncbi:MAG: hypothetical protein HOP30_10230 [Cyclobacteriaceae bacterium]|nr:hypothetical protein [Cyclobacteriaceae bacterium]
MMKKGTKLRNGLSPSSIATVNCAWQKDNGGEVHILLILPKHKNNIQTDRTAFCKSVMKNNNKHGQSKPRVGYSVKKKKNKGAEDAPV